MEISFYTLTSATEMAVFLTQAFLTEAGSVTGEPLTKGTICSLLILGVITKKLTWTVWTVSLICFRLCQKVQSDYPNPFL